MAKLNKRPELFLTDELYAALSAEQRAQCHKEIVSFYFGDRGMCKETVPQFVDVSVNNDTRARKRKKYTTQKSETNPLPKAPFGYLFLNDYEATQCISQSVLHIYFF